MRKMNIKIGFSVSLVLSLALVVTGMIKNGINAEAGNIVDSEVGSITYATANLFDYDESLRSDTTGNWLVGETETDTDASYLLFDQFCACPEIGPVPSNYNAWIDFSQNNIVKGLVNSTLNDEGNVELTNDRTALSGKDSLGLFDETETDTYYGSYNFPLENIGDGWLQYASKINHVNITNSLADNGNYDMFRSDDLIVSEEGFIPFNELDLEKGADTDGYYDIKGNLDLNFGMALELTFNKTEDGKITLKDGSKQDMVFEFASSGDLWVFVDGELVLDIGGVHEVAAGCINFADGSVYTCGNHFDTTNWELIQDADAEYNYSSYLKSLLEGEHELKVFYLQRGGEKSDLMMALRLQEAVGEDAPVVTENPEYTDHTGCTEIPTTEIPVTEVPATKTPATEVPATEVPVTEVPVTEVPVTTAPAIIIEEPVIPHTVIEDPAKTETPAATVAVKDNVDSKANTVAIEDEATPTGALPQTGTVAEKVFYILGAIFIIVGLFIAFYPKKRVSK